MASHSITATYEGDATFGGSVSAPSAYLVTPKPLTITGVTATDKIYDGNATADLTGGTVSGGVVGGETVTVVPGSGTFASRERRHLGGHGHRLFPRRGQRRQLSALRATHRAQRVHHRRGRSS